MPHRTSHSEFDEIIFRNINWILRTPEAEELGEHFYTYSIYSYKVDWRDAAISRMDFEIRQPLFALKMDHTPESGRYLSSVESRPDNLVLSALKKAEDDDSIIMRFFETTGSATTAVLTLPNQVHAVQPTNLLEEDEGSPLEVIDGKCKLAVCGFEIVTLRLICK